MDQYITDKRTTLAKGKQQSWKSSHGDILDLALMDPDYGNTAPLTEIRDQLKSFWFAGHDTTASTISWAYYYLSRNPAELATLRNELDGVFGPQTTSSEMAKMLVSDAKLLNKLDFTLSVVKEALRLEPPAAPAREPAEDYYFKTRAGITFEAEKGVMVFTSAYLVHRNPNVWGQDADEFRPARFMPGKIIPWAYIPFSKRPRDCIGFSLAYLEVFVTFCWN
jgi:cytochrome P450